MIRIFLFLLTFIYCNSYAKATELDLHNNAIADQRIAVKVEFFDGEMLNILIAKNVWARFLSKVTWQDATQQKIFRYLTELVYHDGVYFLRNLPGIENLTPEQINQFKFSLNHYLVVPVTVEMLGYKNFDDFRINNISCENLGSKTFFSCQLKASSFINIQHASYIMATNGYLINASGYLEFSNVKFIGKIDD